MMRRPLKAGVFAAGFGTRLGGPDRGPKGLTAVAGQPLIDWVLDDLLRAGAEEIVIIINKESAAIREHVDRRGIVTVRWIVETTPSSMHSFLRVMEELARDGDGGPMLMSTVDTVAPPGAMRTFVDRAAAFPDADVVLALTANLDDDNPFRVRMDGAGGEGAAGNVVAFDEGSLATAGYSLARPSVLREAEAARRDGLAALRQFFVRLLARGYRFAGVGMPDSVDVDRAADIAAAERLVRSAVS